MTPALIKVTPRQVAFAKNFVGNGGNATKAALAAGYGKAGAHVVASNTLRQDAVLVLIVAEIARGAPGTEKVRRSLLRPSRPPAIRLRAEMLLAHPEPANLIGPPDNPRLVVDRNSAALRDFVVKHGAPKIPIPNPSVPNPGTKSQPGAQ